jgi:molybdopterin synthase catalytic subunit
VVDNRIKMSVIVQISTTPLNVQACLHHVSGPGSGGIDLFVGTVRDNTAGRKVTLLEFEAYEPMALAEMNKIGVNASEKWPIHAIALHHRTGILRAGDIAVIIAVSAAHRSAAFDACRFAIDTLKETVPIWKKEFFEDGEVWVAAHP